ncbi:hypothetical protein Agabi119p4_4691 [Agaricus bisporus var. burnettii]|uniref:Sodium/calcium exchanger membrane region domain-containing protein n=1 Tax=Agaricus bisporus var. burnettii TaxID=192524 RepID=A0A8H7KHL4_AGABI|nr:hypothetical protein Agabi119p4_4691 [Agaricus bisporus var. burnettii]
MSEGVPILNNGNTRQRMRGNSRREFDPENGAHEKPHIPGLEAKGFTTFTDRFLRRGKRQVGILESFYNIATSSFLNLFIVFVPVSWALHFRRGDLHEFVFAFSFLAIIPLERLFDYCGEQMAFYCGNDLGDLIVITLNNAVEATLAVILLIKKDYRVLQSTIIGVILLHLLLVPGTAFITGGARVVSQDLNSHITELNHTLLLMGVLSLVLPAAFFAALDHGTNTTIAGEEAIGLLTDETRDMFLRFSRGISVILLVMYICSRIYLHDPPGDNNALQVRPDAVAAVKENEERLAKEEPGVNQWICIVVIVAAVTLMAATAEFLVESIEGILPEHEEWFGLILLPIVSFAADGTVAVLNFCKSIYHHIFHTPMSPIPLAKARAIDLSIQFTLFWMPFLVLLAWWTHKPFGLLFDLFEVAALVGACFLVNYITADAKTNWAEGCAMVGFYTMIGLCAWYYPGQPEIELFLHEGSITALAQGGLEGAHHEAAALVIG